MAIPCGLLRFHQLLDEVDKARLDLLQSYHQILMKDEDVSKISFWTHQGHYEFCVMPFGLCNMPSSFQATMNNTFIPYLHKFIIVFFDDILIYSKTLTNHLLYLERTFQVLLDGHFFLKLSKCAFAQCQIEYLGHLVSKRRVEPVQAKVQAIQ